MTDEQRLYVDENTVAHMLDYWRGVKTRVMETQHSQGERDMSVAFVAVIEEVQWRRRQAENLEKEARTYRAGFEGALRYLAEEVYDDVRAPFDPNSKGFTPEYRNDLASMRAARALLP